MTDRIALPLSPRPRVSLLVVAAFNAELLRRSLAAVAATTDGDAALETVVVLNGAQPDVARVVREQVTGVRVVESPGNLGFPAAANLGRAAARGELLVLLHDDTEVQPGWLDALVETADGHPEAGAVGALALWPDGRVQAAGWVVWRDGSATRLAEGRTIEDVDPSLRAVDFCGSTLQLVRASTWDRVGGLDDGSFPVGHVDANLAMAIRAQGQVVLLDPRARVLHHKGASIADPRYAAFVNEQTRRRFVERWGTELEQHGERDERPATLEREVDRAATRAERLTTAWKQPSDPPPKPAPAPFTPDAPPQERLEAALVFARRDTELRAGYAAELTRELDVRQAQLEDATRQLSDAAASLADLGDQLTAAADERALLVERREAAEQQARRRSDELDAITSGRWWRLRLRLRALLRR